MITNTELANVVASLDEVRANVAHGEAQYNPWALQALKEADGLLADYQAACREITELKAAIAAAEARGRREGQQWAIDALRDDERYARWREPLPPYEIIPMLLMPHERAAAADYLDSITKEEGSRDQE